ncbi:hypothetical protein [Mesorhizobium sp. CA16]|uniref:hypothetical protein n=1 Tax=Mesorhizobium sp. CA16 TaxID=588496 RepID=UPI001CCFA6FB|nr:hypothetical protein [Mesorhizobium sp. CA16]MBZ9914010.1 hypothetical protein [Mesorhizobium sp. CA16]
MAIKVPLDLNEAFVDRHAEIDPTTGSPVADPVMSSLSNAVKLAREGAVSLRDYETAATADRSVTPEWNILRIAEAARKTGQRVAGQMDAARSKAIAEIEAIEKRISAPPAPKDNVALSIESDITRTLASMGDKERTDAVAKAKADNNETILAAILRRPAMVSGLGEAQLESIRHHYRAHLHPADYARLQRLRKAVEATERSGHLFVSIVNSAADTPAARLAAANARAVEDAQRLHAGQGA